MILEKPSIQGKNLVGEWILDLRPSPDADAYLQSLIINNQDEKIFTGLFYGSPIQDAYLNGNWDKLYFAFKTTDDSSEYYQSGYVVRDSIFGITYCPKRSFVMPWSGKRKMKD